MTVSVSDVRNKKETLRRILNRGKMIGNINMFFLFCFQTWQNKRGTVVAVRKQNARFGTYRKRRISFTLRSC